MIALSDLSSKYAFLVVWLVIGPMICDMQFVLQKWLKVVPAFTVPFTVLMLAALLVEQITSGYMASAQAGGRIALYQILISALLCSSIPVGYFALRAGASAVWVLAAGVGAAVMAGIGRLAFMKRMFQIRFAEWARIVLLPCGSAALVGGGAMLGLHYVLRPSMLRFLTFAGVNGVLTVLIVLVAGLSELERKEYRSLYGRLTASLGRQPAVQECVGE